MTKTWQSPWQPGLEARSALAYERGDLFSIIPRSLPTTTKRSSKEGVLEKDRSLDDTQSWSFVNYLGAKQISSIRLWTPWRSAASLVLQRVWWVLHTCKSSVIFALEELSKNTSEKWNAGQHAWYKSDSREQLVVSRLLFPCTLLRMKGETGSSILYCTLRPYLEFSSSHLGATFKSLPIRLTGACSSKNNQTNRKLETTFQRKNFWRNWEFSL